MPSKAEILSQIEARLEEDEDFAQDLGKAVETNDWNWVESLIKSVLEFVAGFAVGFLQSLMRSIFG